MARSLRLDRRRAIGTRRGRWAARGVVVRGKGDGEGERGLACERGGGRKGRRSGKEKVSIRVVVEERFDGWAYSRRHSVLGIEGGGERRERRLARGPT